MKQVIKKKSNLWRAVFACLFVLSLLAVSSQVAQAQEPVYSECLPSSLNCTANDFGDLALFSYTSKSSCIDHDNNGSYEMLLDFTIHYVAASATRYDIGSVLAVDGIPAQRLTPADNPLGCVRDYLPPPLTETNPAGVTAWPVDGAFWNGEVNPQNPTGDACGDLPPRDYAVRSYTDVWVACVDQYDAINGTVGTDGRIDMNLCVFYDNNTQNACNTVFDATAGTTAKCGCGYYVTFPFTPTAVSLAGLSARSSQGFLMGGLGLLLVVGATGSFLLYRKQTAKAS